MFEHRPRPLAAHRVYIARRLRSLAVAGCILLPSLGLGVLGYHGFGHLPWIDALLNASMILTGMGPVDPLQTVAAKLFASCYALFSGIIFITTSGVLLAPVVHRVLHKFHLEIQPDRSSNKTAEPLGTKAEKK
jgi:hypothetical protein